MSQWTIDAPRTLRFDGVVALRIRLIAGSVAVLATDDSPSLEVSSLTGQPLQVRHEAGMLTIGYPGLDGLQGWLRPQLPSAAVTVMVPRECPCDVTVVSATAIVSGICAAVSARSVSGKITLDGVIGPVDAKTVVGDVESQGLAGRVGFNSVSGDLTVADGTVERLDAKTLSGRVTADIEPSQDAALRVATVSGAVAIRLPAPVNLQVNLRSTAGRVESDFGGLTMSRAPGGSTLTGTLGSGTARLSVTTMSGQVTLLERNHRQPPGTGTERDAT